MLLKQFMNRISINTQEFKEFYESSLYIDDSVYQLFDPATDIEK